ncbi:MAG: hypothetical protein NDF55_03970 [archaeon GB-1867-005]|nr:hypothetical protein [Candidatus Culexmicrobium cathedralense]
MPKVKRKRGLILKLFAAAIISMAIIGLSIYFLQPLNVVNLKAKYKGAHVHAFSGAYRICLIFEVKNDRSAAVVANVEIDLSGQGVPVSRITQVIDGKTGSRLEYEVKSNYVIVVRLSLDPNEVRQIHVVL